MTFFFSNRDDRFWKGIYSQIPKEVTAKIFVKAGDTKVIFVAPMMRVNSQNQAAERVLLLTEKSLYYLDPKSFALKHRIDLKTLSSVVVSSKPGWPSFSSSSARFHLFLQSSLSSFFIFIFIFIFSFSFSFSFF